MRDIDLKAISAAENSNKFQKTRIWKEKSVEDVVTLGPTAQATLVFVEISLGFRSTNVCNLVKLQKWFQGLFFHICDITELDIHNTISQIWLNRI